MQHNVIKYPSSRLSPYIKHYWILRTNGSEAATIQTIPSGCMHLVFHRGTRMRYLDGGKQPSAFVRGQFNRSGTIFSSGNLDMIAVIFHPMGFSHFSGFPIGQLLNKYADLDTLEDRNLKELKLQVMTEPNPDICIGLIEHFLSTRLTEEKNGQERMRSVMRSVMNNERITIDSLASAACLSYRQFKRVFEKYIGINPKEYCRVVRFQRLLNYMQQYPDREILDFAYTCGYYDQSHLTKEFWQFTGSTPFSYLSTHTPHSTLFSHDCRLNVIKSVRKN